MTKNLTKRHHCIFGYIWVGLAGYNRKEYPRFFFARVRPATAAWGGAECSCTATGHDLAPGNLRPNSFRMASIIAVLSASGMAGCKPAWRTVPSGAMIATKGMPSIP